MLSNTLQSLDILSTSKTTSFLLIHNQFVDLLLLFLNKESSEFFAEQLKDFKTHSCEKCEGIKDEPASAVIIALRVLCRATAFQLEALITHKFDEIKHTDGT